VRLLNREKAPARLARHAKAPKDVRLEYRPHGVGIHVERAALTQTLVGCVVHQNVEPALLARDGVE
jgi:hypothetical protein